DERADDASLRGGIAWAYRIARRRRHGPRASQTVHGREIRRAGAALSQRPGCRRPRQQIPREALIRAAHDEAPPRQRIGAGYLELRAPRNPAFRLIAEVEDVRVRRRGAADVGDRAVGGGAAEEPGSSKQADVEIELERVVRLTD